MNCFTLKVILTVAITLITASCSFVNEKSYINKDVTLCDKEFLKGKVSSIIYDDEQGYDSILFVYNSKQHLVKTVYYSDKEERGYCRYNYNGFNRIDQHYYDNNHKETSYSIIEFDNNKNVTLCRDYGYIYPDTTKKVLLYMIQKSYNENNQLSDAFEYHCDGIPPYKYYYSYNNDGTETEECFLVVTGDIYSITKRKKDNRGNIIEESKNFPGDTYDRTSLKIEYKYDDKGNWIERRFMDEAPERYRNKYSKRRIHYLDE